jgi:hypothetical protein
MKKLLYIFPCVLSSLSVLQVCPATLPDIARTLYETPQIRDIQILFAGILGSPTENSMLRNYGPTPGAEAFVHTAANKDLKGAFAKLEQKLTALENLKLPEKSIMVELINEARFIIRHIHEYWKNVIYITLDPQSPGVDIIKFTNVLDLTYGKGENQIRPGNEGFVRGGIMKYFVDNTKFKEHATQINRIIEQLQQKNHGAVILAEFSGLLQQVYHKLESDAQKTLR